MTVNPSNSDFSMRVDQQPGSDPVSGTEEAGSANQAEAAARNKEVGEKSGDDVAKSKENGMSKFALLKPLLAVLKIALGLTLAIAGAALAPVSGGASMLLAVAGGVLMAWAVMDMDLTPAPGKQDPSPAEEGTNETVKNPTKPEDDEEEKGKVEESEEGVGNGDLSPSARQSQVQAQFVEVEDEEAPPEDALRTAGEPPPLPPRDYPGAPRSE